MVTSTETAPQHASEHQPEEPLPGRWWQRALPVTGIVLALVAVAALVVPGFRHQLVLSTTHQPQPYVELYFARTAAGTQVVCSGTHRSVRVSFAVTSHLPETRHLRYDVSVRPASGGVPVRRTGSTTVAQGHTATVSEQLARPAGRRYDVAVRLPALGQHLLAHCPGAGS